MTEYLEFEGGRLAYDVSGESGPLLVLTPGIGDLRASYRFLTPLLARAGQRVATLDLRGTGESSADWQEYTPEAVGRDMLALVDRLGGGPALLGGCSMAAASAAWAALTAPNKVAGLIFFGPSLHAGALSLSQRSAMTLGFAGPWRVRFWDMFFGTLFPERKPEDLEEYRGRLRENLAEPNRMEALRSFIYASKAAISQRLGEVAVPTLVIMGGRDPDFSDPAAQAAEDAALVHGEAVVLAEAGHYPQADSPEESAVAILKWIANKAPVFLP